MAILQGSNDLEKVINSFRKLHIVDKKFKLSIIVALQIDISSLEYS